MKKIFTLFFALSLSFFSQAQMTNNGATLSISTGTIVQVNSDFTNKSGSNLVNNGTLNIKGNLTNDQTMNVASSGVLKLEGTVSQTVSGSAPYFAKDVVFNNASGITISKSLKADGEIKFQNGLIVASNSSEPVVFSANATVSATNAPSDASHINGYVIKEGTGAFVYPIGDDTRYQPVGVNLTANGSGLKAKYNATDAGAVPLSGSLLSYNNQEYWDLTPTTSAIGKVTIYWDDYKNPPITNISDLLVAHQTGGSWISEGATVIAGTTTLGSVTSNDVSTWSPFTLGSTTNVLPIILLTFRGESIKSANRLYWATSTEYNNKGFEVERSIDAKSFEKIGFVASQGSSASIQQYTFTDAYSILEANIVYYRLKQLDSDGHFTYSVVIAIAQNTTKQSLSIYPNPSNGIFNVIGIQNLEQSQFVLLNSVGQLLTPIHIEQNGVINISNLSAGMYYLQERSSGQVNKLIIE